MARKPAAKKPARTGRTVGEVMKNANMPRERAQMILDIESGRRPGGDVVTVPARKRPAKNKG